MGQSPYITLFRENNTNVWVAVSPSLGERPVVERSVNLHSWYEKGDSEAMLNQRIRDSCHLWYERQVNLREYCKQALGWIGHTADGTKVELKTIDAQQAVWEYRWQKKTYQLSFQFGRELMCVDWVHHLGLTLLAQSFILSEVANAIGHHKEAAQPEQAQKRRLIMQLLSKLPQRQDFGREVATLLSPFGHLVPPLKATVLQTLT